MGQLIKLPLNIYDIDEEATKNAVEKYLLQAREYQITEYIPLEQKMTASYELRDYKPSNIISSPVEDIAIKNIDEINRRQKHIERAYKAINRLGTKQQNLIRMRYMEDDYIADFEVAAELEYSDRHYRRLKSIAIYRLATMLGLLVLKEE